MMKYLFVTILGLLLISSLRAQPLPCANQSLTPVDIQIAATNNPNVTLSISYNAAVGIWSNPVYNQTVYMQVGGWNTFNGTLM